MVAVLSRCAPEELHCSVKETVMGFHNVKGHGYKHFWPPVHATAVVLIKKTTEICTLKSHGKCHKGLLKFGKDCKG